MVIDRGSPVPPWRQAYAIIRGQIESGELPPGSRLPSIAGLAQEYDLAISTVQKMIRQLQDDELIVTSPMGTFVA
jgi:GntR family transcriptional regulator